MPQIKAPDLPPRHFKHKIVSMKVILLFISLCLIVSGCATNAEKRMLASGIAFGAGTVIGGASAPADERKEMHAVYWGGILGLATSLAANYYLAEEKETEALREENEKLKMEIKLMSNGPTALLKESTLSGGKSKIKLFKVDQWVNDGPNKKYHRDQVIEVLPVDQGP